MLTDLSEMKAKNAREKFDKVLVGGIIGTKHKLGGLGYQRIKTLSGMTNWLKNYTSLYENISKNEE